MAYNYLIDLYENIEKRLHEAEENYERAVREGDASQAAFHEGRKSILNEMELFLAKNYNRLLPKKILKILEERGPAGIN